MTRVSLYQVDLTAGRYFNPIGNTSLHATDDEGENGVYITCSHKESQTLS
jgi:hypothetical protein